MSESTTYQGTGAPARDPAPGTSYYLSLGDSLAQGIQPGPAGGDEPTSEGYPEVLAARSSMAARIEIGLAL